MDKLRLDSEKYEIKTAEFGGRAVTYRAFEDIPYCTAPKDPIQKLSIFAPEAYYHEENINGYNAETAPILMPNSVGGYMEGGSEVPGEKMFAGHGSGRANILFEALIHGYVVVSAGIRGRNSKCGGRAPALIVDMKAAIRYIRHNRDLIPGDTEKIFTDGTSAGGALSSLAGATGNSPDYEPYLNEIGAANERDDIFGAICFCPITNLEHADMAYEWMFASEREYTRGKMTHTPEGVKREIVHGKMSDEQMKISEDLAALFPEYVNSLHLKDKNGNVLTLDGEGDGTFADYVGGLVFDSAEAELKDHRSSQYIAYEMTDGSEVEAQEFLDIRDGRLICLDWDGYVHSITRMKTAPAFDSLDMDTPENDEFGTEEEKRHFTEYASSHSKVGGSMADPQIIKMLNPMNYIGAADTAPFWRIRHGAYDRDTSLAISAILALALENKGYNVDLKYPWGLPHCGDYDMEDIFAWIDKVAGVSEN